MSRRLAGLLFLVVVIQAASTTIPQKWNKPGATPRDFEDDSYTCQVHSGMNVQRFYTGQLAGFQALADADAQRKAYIQCMHAYGWTEVQE